MLGELMRVHAALVVFEIIVDLKADGDRAIGHDFLHHHFGRGGAIEAANVCACNTGRGVSMILHCDHICSCVSLRATHNNTHRSSSAWDCRSAAGSACSLSPC